MLDKTELKNRIDALRTLRGLTQVDLAELFAARGHGTQELGRLERGALPLTGIRKRTLAEILEVPEWFFEEEHLDLIGQPELRARAGLQLDRLEQAVTALAQREDTASKERQEIRRLLASITELLKQQDKILKEMQRVAAGMPKDETMRMFNEGARLQVDAARALQAERAAASEAPAETPRRGAGDA